MSKKELMVGASEEQIAILDELYPADQDNFQEIRLPRLGMLSKDIVEETGTGKNKKIKIIQPSGTFYTEVETEEEEDILDEKGKKIGTKKVWDKQFIEDEESIDAVIFFHRKQLRFYDEPSESYISSPIYDDSNEEVPLFQGRNEIARGKPADLQAKYPSLTAKGKPSSKLKEVKILYVLYKDQVYQFNLSESSKYAFLTYSRKNQPQKLVTTIGSIEQTKGSNVYRQATFEAKGPISAEQADLVIQAVTDIKAYLEAKKARYTKAVEAERVSGDFSEFAGHIADEGEPVKRIGK